MPNAPHEEISTAYGILGPLSVASVPQSRGQQARVLGVLLLERGSMVTASTLAMWALGTGRTSDTAQVHVLVARLRRVMRENSLPGALTSVSSGYRFDVHDDEVDAGRFEHLAREAEHVWNHDLAGARRLVDEALALWRGDVLAGLGLAEHPAADRLEERRLASLELGFVADLGLGRRDSLPDMLDAARRLPQRERLAVIAMTGLFLAGRQTEALALYQRTRQYLAGRGIEPGFALHQAESAVFRHDVDDVLHGTLGISRSTARLTPSWATGRTVAGVGRHETHPASIPRFVNSFVGRDDLVSRVSAASTEPGLLTLVGPGGVGKTRLVCEAIGRWHAGLDRPVWFCEVAALDGGTEVAADDDGLDRLVARVVGIRLEPGRPVRDAVVENLAGRRGTLVLDSCETQVAPAAELTSRLLASCPSLTILTTSRLPLGVAGEEVTPVPPLETEGEATELYCHRAIDADPGFVLEADDTEAIARLCVRLDNLPLAIELAAARSRTAGPHELLAYLDDLTPAHLQQSEPFAGAARHRSLESTIDWSYRLLTEEQEGLLRRLAVFSSSVGIDDVAAVCDDGKGRGPLLQRLAELVERSMVATARRDGVTRYRLLDTIRAFAAGRSANLGEFEDVRRQHAVHYIHVLDDLRSQLRGPGEAAAVARLDDIWPEVRVAVAWTIAARRTDLAVRLVAGLGFEAVFRERGEIVAWADDVVRLPGGMEQPGADELLGTAALADWGYGRFDQGLHRAKQAVALHRQRATQLSPDVAAALPLHLSLRGDLDETLRVLQAHAAEAEADGQMFAHVHMLICAAMSLGFAGSPEADHVLVEAEDVAARLGCPLLQAIAAFTRAIVVLDRRAEEAVAHARRALALAHSVRATWFLSAGTNYLVAALARSAETESTLEHLRAGLERQQTGGTVQSAANSIRNTIVVLDRLGRAERAVPLIGWLAVNRPSIPGSPGMRNHPGELAQRLRNELGEVRFEELRSTGADLTLPDVIALALHEISDLGDRLGPAPT